MQTIDKSAPDYRQSDLLPRYTHAPLCLIVIFGNTKTTWTYPSILHIHHYIFSVVHPRKPD